MDLRNDMLTIPIDQRFTLDDQQNLSRYTTSGFLRIKLGEALEKRGVAAHIFESADEAQSDWRNVEGGAGLRPAPSKRAV